MKNHFTLIVLLVLFLPSCSPASTPTPTPDSQANETRIAAIIFATQTASAPTATSTLTATNTVTPTNTPKVSPTITKAATVARVAASPTRPSQFTFQWNNPHYECQTKAWTREDGTQAIGARSFQITIAVKNGSTDKTLSPSWQPSRWFITNGKTTRTDKGMWQWVSKQSGYYQQPVVSPGVVAEWTFLAFPLQLDEWVSYLEWDLFGQTYRSTQFDPGEFRNNYNYKPCP